MILQFMNEQMKALNIPYRFWEWGENPPQTYFVGEFDETSMLSEDGGLEGDFILSGFTRGTFADLEVYRAAIFARFRNGLKAVKDGHGLAIYYDHASPVDTGLEGIKRVDIYLTTYEWSE